MARSRNLDDQQERLSEATWSVLTERGLPGLTIRAVADRAGCTTGLVMHAFPTKQALLLHARDLLHARTAATADAAEAAGREAGGAEGALLSVLWNSLALDRVGEDAARVWVSFLAAALVDRTLAERHQAQNRRFVERIARLVRGCRPEWGEDRARAEALGLVSLSEGLGSLAAADPETYTVAVQRHAMAEAVRRGVGADRMGAAGTSADGAGAAGTTAAETGAAETGAAEASADRRTGAVPTSVATQPAGAAATVVAEKLVGLGVTGADGTQVRAFREPDTEAVVALWVECGLTRPWNDPGKDVARKLGVQRDLFLVAEDDGRVVGTAMAGYDGHRAWVNYLAVAPALQGRGLGRRLMAEVERLLLERGCPKVNLQIREGNEPVMEFYRALGYERDAAVSFGKRLIAD
jgi:ribosomal protein S18 acetylase RimI-like enzyme/AcrR family transcriptional regulator